LPCSLRPPSPGIHRGQRLPAQASQEAESH
jgi:hypothetical protein